MWQFFRTDRETTIGPTTTSDSPRKVAGKFADMTSMERVQVVQQMMRKGVSEVIWQCNSQDGGVSATSRGRKKVLFRVFF